MYFYILQKNNVYTAIPANEQLFKAYEKRGYSTLIKLLLLIKLQR
ncbi:hypothetical protein SAMN02745724_04341 [Pseudoalteromonas denitrificans DSM 6059]|uniref:Uncharacterized protein n=1 Tax=Pseudoalteromonas denitrificans DSM 6059 TaxID=1123010 RepID=A0A1I1RTB2_9GAMM|nr:hypothetical protein SAMN02745724_04341 [Pseudoalteromonas denitrificans DSM 6059]